MKAQLQKVRETIQDQDISPEARSAAIDELFAMTQQTCELACEETIRELRAINQAHSLENLDRIYATLPPAIKARFPHKEKELKEIGRKMSHALQNSDPQRISNATGAMLEVLRYLIKMEEDSLTRIKYGNIPSKAQGAADLATDLLFLKKQFRALMNIHNGFSKPGAMENPEEVKKVVQAIDDLGLLSRKVAQSFSNLGLLSQPLQDGLKVFQEDEAPAAPDEVMRILREELGRDPREIFHGFDPARPLKSGTIATTFVSEIGTPSGRKKVIVKVQRPRLAEQLAWDHKTTVLGAKAVHAFTPRNYLWFSDLLEELLHGFINSIHDELDFLVEARNLRKFRTMFSMNHDVIIPKVYDDYTTRRVLTIEYIEGGRNLEKAIAELNGIQGKDEVLRLKKLYFSRLLRGYLHMLVSVGEAHADLHPGNILATRDHRLAFIDFGTVFKPDGMFSAPMNFGLGFLTGDMDQTIKGLREMGELPPEAEERLRTTLARHFDEMGLSGHMKFMNAYKVMNGKTGPDTGESLSKGIQKTFEEILKNGYRPKPTYIQFARSASPLIAALGTIAKDIPEQELRPLILDNLKSFVGNLPVDFLGPRIFQGIDYCREKFQGFRSFFK